MTALPELPMQDLARVVAAVRGGTAATARVGLNTGSIFGSNFGLNIESPAGARNRVDVARPRARAMFLATATFFASIAIFLHGAHSRAWSVSPTEVSSAEELKMSTKMRLLAAAVGGVVLSGASSAHAQDAVQWRVEDGGNGHWYQLRIVGPIEWPDATIDAATHGGHLATIASEMENSFVVALASVGPGWVQNYGPWLGGFQNPLAADYSEPRGGWRWWDGESIEWAQWDVKGADEPNNCWCNCGSEDFLHLKASEILGASAVWNDLNGSSAAGCVQPISYIIEWSADCNSDGIVDYGQIRAGELVDTNANNIPDCCEQGFDCRFNAVQWRVEDGGNGHWYECKPTDGSMTWNQLEVDSRGRGGYLATVTEATEFNFVAALSDRRMNAYQLACSGCLAFGPFLGGFQDQTAATYAEPSGAWRWSNGEEFRFSAWAGGEPNDADCLIGGGFGPANHLQIVRDTWGMHFWNDIGETGMTCYGNLAPSYILEFSADCNSDGIVDYGQIRAGELVDTNANNIPDCCEQATSCVPCAADIDESGAVNSVDLAAVLSNWGSDGGKYPRADIDGDGTVSSTDLAAVLSAWGPCE